MVRDLSDPVQVLRRQQDNVRRTNSRTRAQNTSVDKGSFRIKSPEGLEVGTATDPTGSQVVYGTLTIVGTLNGDGTMTWSGDVTLTGTFKANGPWELNGAGTIAGNTTGTGTLTWTGPWNLNGTGKIQGPVDITGILRLLSDLRVESGGKITVTGADGDTVIQNSRVTFPNGSAIRTDGAGLQITQGSAQAAVFDGIARLRAGTKTLSVGSGFFANLNTIDKATLGAWAQPNMVVINSSNELLKVV